MTALSNRVGPTRIWKTVNGKNVKTNDGIDLGEIKKISQNHLLLQKGKVLKERFWIPKYIADAFDGKILWLLLSEEEVRGKYQYGKEPPTGEKYSSEFESFKRTPYGQKRNYGPAFEENIRLIENYDNIRDLHTTALTDDNSKYLKTHIEGPRPAEGPTPHMMQEAESPKENDKKEKDKQLEAEKVEVSKQPIKFGSPRISQGVVESLTTDSKSAELKGRGIKNADSTGYNPIRLPSSQITPERLKKVTEEDKIKAPKNDNASLSPVRITSEAQISMQPMRTTSGAIAQPSVASSPLSSSSFPISTKDEHREIVSNLSTVELSSTKIEEIVDDNTIPTVSNGSTTMMVATSTSIVSDKEIDGMPVLAQAIPMLTKAKEEEHQIVPVSEKNIESNIIGLDTLTLRSKSVDETESTNSGQVNQLTPQAEGLTETEIVSSTLEYHLNPFLAGLTIWQGWFDMYNEFAETGTRLNLNWIEHFWKLFIPTAVETDNLKNSEPS